MTHDAQEAARGYVGEWVARCADLEPDTPLGWRDPHVDINDPDHDDDWRAEFVLELVRVLSFALHLASDGRFADHVRKSLADWQAAHLADHTAEET